MYQSLGTLKLGDGSTVEVGRVDCPDLSWADRIEALLQHKSPLYVWQNSCVIREHCGLDVFFYVLHRDGEPLASIMTVENRKTGFLGHVWTRPEDRRKGAATMLLDATVEDFKNREGVALFLRTDYDSSAYHIYATKGFVGIEDGSGQMALYRADETTFYQSYFRQQPWGIRCLNWSDWPASGALFLGEFPTFIRSVGLKQFGRCTTEDTVLELLEREKKREAHGLPPSAKVLVLEETGAIAGLAHWRLLDSFDDVCLLDFFCHPTYTGSAFDLVSSLELPESKRVIALADVQDRTKEEALEELDFRPVSGQDLRILSEFPALNGDSLTLWGRGFN